MPQTQISRIYEKSILFMALTIQIRQYTIGDLARDAKEDKEFPRHSTSYKNIKAHLDFNSASIDALEIFERAFVRYKEETQMGS